MNELYSSVRVNLRTIIIIIVQQTKVTLKPPCYYHWVLFQPIVFLLLLKILILRKIKGSDY